MRTLLLSKADEVYLQKCAAEPKSYGIIIGQQAEADKFIAAHLARNGEEDLDVNYLLDDNSEKGAHSQQKVDDIDTQALTNQWLSANKMIPGSFSVLGVFISGNSAETLDEPTFSSAKKLLYEVHNLLVQGSAFTSNIDDFPPMEYLFVAYSTVLRKAFCKSYSHAPNGGAFTSMDCRFVEKPFIWHAFECNYELDDIFPVLDMKQKINIEHQFQKTLGSLKKSLTASEIFIQNETVDDRQVLDDYLKRLRENKQKGQPEPTTLKVTIFLPVKCQISTENPIKVRPFKGTIRFTGVLSSRIWCNPKTTLGEIKRYVRTDILRSLAARIQVYCDGLTEPNISVDTIFIGEPPRRVYFELASDVSSIVPIQFSEYIFRGEAPTVAVAQAKQVLDLDLNNESIMANMEGLPHEEDLFSAASSEEVANEPAPKTSVFESTRNMYLMGIALAMLVLVVSVLVSHILQL